MLFIPIEQLKSGLELSDDVMVFEGSNARLLPKGTVLTEQFISRLKIFGVPGVYIHSEIAKDIKPSEPLLPKELKDESLDNLQDMFEDAGNHMAIEQKQIKQIDQTILELIDLMKENQSQLVNISDLRAYDEYTYHHSLSVAVVALAIGMQLNLSHDELHTLGFSAIMHDIGKMSIPKEIINKPTQLTTGEFQIMQKHPESSEKYLLENNIENPAVYENVISHHEKLDGTGYPNRLKDEDIPYNEQNYFRCRCLRCTYF